MSSLICPCFDTDTSIFSKQNCCDLPEQIFQDNKFLHVADVVKTVS